MLDRAGVGAAIEERYVFRPGILRAFGWRVVDVPVSSWLRARNAVIERIETELTRSSWDLADANPMAGTTLPSPTAVPILAEDDVEQAPAPGWAEYRFVAGSSNKFWRVGLDGSDLIVEYGRVGTKGQRVVKTFPDEARARREANKLTLKKTGKGYEEFG